MTRVAAVVEVQVWSDVVCPWCYIGKRRFEEAMARFEHREQIDLRWRSFELDPHAPRVRGGNYAEHLARKYAISTDKALESQRRMTQTAAEHGITMRFDLAKPGNTFDAHRLLHLAAEHGLQTQLKERLMAAYFTEGRAIGEQHTLSALAAEVGLHQDLIGKVLSTDEYADDVRNDERLGRDYDISGVPFFVIDGKYAVAGAQRTDVLVDVLEQAWSERD
jgi:predicted DsbA family dithiol-disulfide isomerase